MGSVWLDGWVAEWLKSFEGKIAVQAEAYAEVLAEREVDSVTHSFTLDNPKSISLAETSPIKWLRAFSSPT